MALLPVLLRRRYCWSLLGTSSIRNLFHGRGRRPRGLAMDLHSGGVHVPDFVLFNVSLTKIQGIATVIVAVIAFFTVYDFPETASFLSEEERAFVVYRLKYQSQKSDEQDGAKVAEA